MKRGDVVLVDLNPIIGAEAAKRRPSVVVSNDAANRSAVSRGRGVITVAPVTSNTSRVYPFQILLPPDPGTGLTVASKCQAEQIRSIDVARVHRRLGALSPEQLRDLDAAIRLHLDL
ncbi:MULTISPECIES: type II toxin-antitoxin system PemK/MazF family toxin [unclassified Solwaraspora]|uniref:type II toxin-antitoxin system PemK/MazF family toxin n=1 Tax=unclassified Solwaraspora TaxID=2627926 RepID=UPI00259B35E3|nr:type II toxin-antitoxin system PemK/MazF family toxin [Solwaraspora sp. WMMA2056]WJK41968.1 type II toxin-antitoxin system PemK/MazF family toxin [Solwaraspora sp. WMMA2056]